MTDTRQAHRAPKPDWSRIENSGSGIAKKKVEESFIAVIPVILVGGQKNKLMR